MARGEGLCLTLQIRVPPLDKAGHNILYTGAELHRLYPVYTISMSNQAV